MSHALLPALPVRRALIIVAALALAIAASFGMAPVRAVETDMAISTTTVDFGDVNVGNTSGGLSVTLTNTGGDPFGPISMFGGAPLVTEFGASQNCQGQTLAAGASCTVTYTFTPSEPGVFSGTSDFVISETAAQADGEDFSVTLSGNGVTPITVAPTSIDFGNVAVGDTEQLGVTVTNTSGDPFGPINMFGGSPLTTEFGASQNCQGQTLAAGAACTITYAFTPSGTGAFSDTSDFVISGTASQSGGTDFSIALTGCGETAEVLCPTAPTAPPTPSPSAGATSPGSSAGAGGAGSLSASPALLPDTADGARSTSAGSVAVILGLTLAFLIAAAMRTRVRRA